MTDIFVSYKWENQKIVNPICGYIKSIRPTYVMWIDAAELIAGDNLDGKITNGIDNSKVFLAFISKEYCTSKYCQMEFKYAHEKRKNIVSVMLDQELRYDPGGIRLRITDVLRINAYFHFRKSDWVESLCEELLNSLDAIIQKIYKKVTPTAPPMETIQLRTIESRRRVNIPELVKLCYTRESNLHRIRQLIEQQNANVNYKDSSGRTALHGAILNNHEDIVCLLIANGADLNIKDGDGNIALNLAIYQNDLNMAQLLILKGIDLNIKDANGFTALSLAVCRNDFDFVKLLVDNGANLNVKNSEGVTALMIATEKNFLTIAKYLLENDADLNIRNVNGYTALILVIRRNNLEIAEILINIGADLNKKDKEGNTALILASRYGFFNIVQLMVKNGANLQIKNDKGRTALDEAWNNQEIRQYLESAATNKSSVCIIS